LEGKGRKRLLVIQGREKLFPRHEERKGGGEWERLSFFFKEGVRMYLPGRKGENPVFSSGR